MYLVLSPEYALDCLERPSHLWTGFNSREVVPGRAKGAVRLHPTPEDHADLVQEASVGPQREMETAPPEPEPAPVAPISRVRQALVTSDDEQPIGRAEVFKGYEVEPDHYVVLDPEELKRLQRRTSPNMEIVRSVKLSEIDPVFFRDLILRGA